MDMDHERIGWYLKGYECAKALYVEALRRTNLFEDDDAIAAFVDTIIEEQEN